MQPHKRVETVLSRTVALVEGIRRGWAVKIQISALPEASVLLTFAELVQAQ